jgi:hypothetical protein
MLCLEILDGGDIYYLWRISANILNKYWILKGSDDGVKHLELLFFLLFPSSGILETRKHDVLEIGSVSILMWWRKTPIQLGLLERALCWALAAFSVTCSYTLSVGYLGGWISPSQGRYLQTEQHKYRIDAHKYPCLEWDSNPRSQLSSERRRFMH